MTLSKYININYMLNISITFFKQKKKQPRKVILFQSYWHPNPTAPRLSKNIYIYIKERTKYTRGPNHTHRYKSREIYRKGVPSLYN